MSFEIIYGCPGGGKTRNLMERLTHHLKTDRDPRVLFMSHTKAAAQEALSRFGAVENDRRVNISTMHSYCFGALRLSRAQIVDDAKLKRFIDEMGMDYEDDSDGKKMMEVISFARAKIMSYGQAYEVSERPGNYEQFIGLASSYDQWKQHFGYIDFNDMLARAAQLTFIRPVSLLLLDEAQDFTPLHWQAFDNIVRRLPARTQIVICGDPDQSIFTWSGADPHLMEQFEHTYKAKRSFLEKSYRVPEEVHAIALQIIRRVGARIDKGYEPRGTGGCVEEWPDIDFLDPVLGRDSLVLYTDRWARELVETRLRERNLAYSAVGGMPAPLDTRAGRALREVARESFDPAGDLSNLRSCLNERGAAIWDRIGPESIIAALQARDLMHVNANPDNIEYLQHVDLSAPIKIRISTIHGSKGMEADDVHLFTQQSTASIRQALVDPDLSHRTFYVGVTRARENLYLYPGDNGYEIPL